MFGRRGWGLYRAADSGGAGASGGQAPADTEGGPDPVSGEDSQPGAGQGSEAGADGWTVEKALAEIKALRAENAKHRKAKSEAERLAQAADEARLAEEKKFAELADKRAKERDDALAKLQEMERSLWRQKAAQAAGLSPELAERLRGDDEAAILADAQALAKLLPVAPAGQGAPPGPQKRPAGKSAEDIEEEALRTKRRRYGTL